MNEANNFDQTELHKFEELASRWWDPESEFRPLHEMNPVRLNFIKQSIDLENKIVLDVGCGGGILSESMAKEGAEVTGIDLGDAPLEIARLHLLESGLDVKYLKSSIEELSQTKERSYDVITCMEMLEHVPDPMSVVRSCYKLIKPGGFVFFSTINRNPKAFLLAILGAEYVLKMLPRGTHDYEKFIKPSELSMWVNEAGLEMNKIIGLTYNPITRVFKLNKKDVDVNYIVASRRPL
tara:strand:+ start:12873 stop:13583 length:711 start_codon:yes stop_codon:yes gene_type:complete